MKRRKKGASKSKDNGGAYAWARDEEIFEIAVSTTIEELFGEGKPRSLMILQNRVLVAGRRWTRKRAWSWRVPFEAAFRRPVVKQIAEARINKIKVVNTSVDEGNMIKLPQRKIRPRMKRRRSRDIYPSVCALAIRPRPANSRALPEAFVPSTKKTLRLGSCWPFTRSNQKAGA